jgi:hypothetical protein
MGRRIDGDIGALAHTPALGVRWTEQLPAPMQMLLVSEPPRLLINAAWWRRAAGQERRAVLDVLRNGAPEPRSDLQLWGRRPLNAAGFTRPALERLPGDFWDRLIHNEC